MEFTKETNRIYANDANGELIAEVTFPAISDDAVVINHTFVDSSLRGQGVAGQLMEAAYATLKESGRKAVLTCPYAIKWYGEHPEKNDIIIEE